MILFVWLGNSLPPLIAMTVTAEYCQMDCCKGKARHLANSCSGGMCHFKVKMDAPHESMRGIEEAAKKPISTNHHEIEHHQNIPVATDKSNVLIFGAEEVLASHNKDLPFLQIKAPERCDQTACIMSSGSSVGQRNTQSSDNCILLSFADKPRPPTIVLVNFGTQVSFNVTQQIVSRRTLPRGPPAFFS